MNHDEQATIERGYINALLMAPHVGLDAAHIRPSLLDVDEVLEEQRRRVFAAMCRILDAGGKTDFATVADELDAMGARDALEELIECASVPSPMTLPSAFAVLRARAYRIERTRIMALAAESERKGEPVDEDELTARLRELRRGEDPNALDPEALVRIALLRLSRAESGRDFVVRTGHEVIDDAIGGLDPGGLTVIGARPSVGKSTLALDIAWRSPARVAVLSVEDPAQTWATRYLAKESGASAMAIRSGAGLSAYDFGEMHKALSSARERKFVIIDASGKTSLAEVRSMMRVSARQNAPQVFIVDYAQAITVNTKGNVDARERINRVIEGVKAEGAQLGAHVILLSQLRRVDNESKEPSRQDLKESGKFEEAAENIILLWRNSHGTVCGRVAKAKGGMPGVGFVLPQSPKTMAFGEAGEMTFQDEHEDGEGRNNKKGGGR